MDIEVKYKELENMEVLVNHGKEIIIDLKNIKIIKKIVYHMKLFQYQHLYKIHLYIIY